MPFTGDLWPNIAVKHALISIFHFVFLVKHSNSEIGRRRWNRFVMTIYLENEGGENGLTLASGVHFSIHGSDLCVGVLYGIIIDVLQ